jgi:hypothetical protein
MGRTCEVIALCFRRGLVKKKKKKKKKKGRGLVGSSFSAHQGLSALPA